MIKALFLFLLLTIKVSTIADSSNEKTVFDLKITQITNGPKHHIFGYIGHCLTIPWNSSERYLLAMEVEDSGNMPEANEYAKIILIDTQKNNKIIYLDKTYAWNPQQGTMFYWNPLAPETQFYFNDRDVASGEVFTVLYDIESAKRIREFRFPESPMGNGGIAPDGSHFFAINYGRLARLRSVTGYPEAKDWNASELAPANDGIFKINTSTGKKELLISYKILGELLNEKGVNHFHTGLFINHTLWNRESDRIFFYLRAGWGSHKSKSHDRINQAVSMKADGSEIILHERTLGGHPEWYKGSLIIGKKSHHQAVYDVSTQEFIEYWEDKKVFPRPGDDIALSPDMKFFVNGHKGKDAKNYYTVYRRSDGSFARSTGINRGTHNGTCRVDPAPRWSRSGDRILVPGIADDGTRQLFMIKIKKGELNEN